MIGCSEITEYIKGVESGDIVASQNVKKLCNHIKECFENEEIFVDKKLLENYMKIGNLMFDAIFSWEKFLIACLLCTYTKDGRPRWNRGLVMIGRGAGKDGFIAWISLCLISKFNPVKHYDVDICANNEDQSTRPVKDVVEFLEKPKYVDLNKKSFHWTLEGVQGKINLGKIKGHTNSPKGKDGLRSGCVILNEIHQYENFENVNVFTTGLGKIAEPRIFMFTTNGDVRDGVLDAKLNEAEQVLNGEIEDNRNLYFLCSLDSKDEVDDPKNWLKANPSLAYNSNLLEETETEYRMWKENPYSLPAFMTKRMNLPQSFTDMSVVDYEYVKATNQPLINLERMSCVCGIDMSRTTDMASVSLLFKADKKRYVINHSWVCTNSQDWNNIKVKDQFPKWVEMGLLTIVDDIEINPQMIVDYIQAMKSKYNIIKVCIDDFRYSIMTYDLAKIGFTKDNKNVKLVKMSDIAKVVPIIESCFINHLFIWGDNPILRWGTQNTKVVSWKTRNTDDSELGNFVYAKIDKHSRKNDAFMSLVASMTSDLELQERVKINMDSFGAVNF